MGGAGVSPAIGVQNRRRGARTTSLLDTMGGAVLYGELSRRGRRVVCQLIIRSMVRQARSA